MKQIVKDKRNVALLVMGTICILTVIVGVAYAYIAYYARQKTSNIIETGCVKLELIDLTEAIHLSATHPITNEAGSELVPYRFQVKNICNTGVNYSIRLDVMDVTNRMESKNVAVKLDKTEVQTLSPSIQVTPLETTEYTAIESYKIGEGTLNPGETKEHELRLWLHESAGNETQNKSFESKIMIEGIQNEIAAVNFTEYIKNLNSLETFTHEATEQTPTLTDYRYTGANPNNYIYFGCNDNCTEDNLYRIIGVIPTKNEQGEYESRVKLIKAKYYNETSSGLLLSSNGTYPPAGGTGKGYQWNSSANNQWQASTLQSKVLNGVYWSSLGEYQEYISPAVWYLGAPTYSSSATYTPDQFYNIERSNTKGYSGGIVYMTANIGLMYPSDYGYSIGSSNKGLSVYKNRENYKNNAWLYNLESKYYEWIMTPESSASIVHAWYLNPAGYVGHGDVYTPGYVWGVRPVFYLTTDVLYYGGNGTKETPYRIGKENGTLVARKSYNSTEYFWEQKENITNIVIED